MRAVPSDPIRTRRGRTAMTGPILASLIILTANAPEPGAGPDADPLVSELLEAHNRERSKENLPPLTIAPKLVEAARVHARDMAEHGLMSHEGSDGSTPAQRVERQGYR